jgi:hypothetical protein
MIGCRTAISRSNPLTPLRCEAYLRREDVATLEEELARKAEHARGLLF